MLASPDSAETEKTTTRFRGWAAVVAAEFPPRGAEIIKDETKSSANSRRVQLFQSTARSFLTLNHSSSVRSKLNSRISYTATHIIDDSAKPSIVSEFRFRAFLPIT